MPKKTTRVTLDMTHSDHKSLKAASCIIGVSMRELINLSVKEYLKNHFREWETFLEKVKADE